MPNCLICLIRPSLTCMKCDFKRCFEHANKGDVMEIHREHDGYRRWDWVEVLGAQID